MRHLREAVVLTTLALSSCMVFQPAEKVVQIETSPPGGMVNVNGILAGTAPCTCSLPRTRGFVEFQILPPREATERLWTQTRTFAWRDLPETGGTLYFDLRLEAAHPVQPVEIRER